MRRKPFFDAPSRRCRGCTTCAPAARRWSSIGIEQLKSLLVDETRHGADERRSPASTRARPPPAARACSSSLPAIAARRSSPRSSGSVAGFHSSASMPFRMPWNLSDTARSTPSSPAPCSGVWISRAYVRRDGRHLVGEEDAALHRIERAEMLERVGRPVAAVQTGQRKRLGPGGTLIVEVVDRVDRARAREMMLAAQAGVRDRPAAARCASRGNAGCRERCRAARSRGSPRGRRRCSAAGSRRCRRCVS